MFQLTLSLDSFMRYPTIPILPISVIFPVYLTRIKEWITIYLWASFSGQIGASETDTWQIEQVRCLIIDSHTASK